MCGLNGVECLGARALRPLDPPRVPAPRDLCYVQNFDDAHRPKLLDLPPGQGPRLADAMSSLVRRLHRALEKAPERSWGRPGRLLEGTLPAIMDRVRLSRRGSMARPVEEKPREHPPRRGRGLRRELLPPDSALAAAPVVVERMPHSVESLRLDRPARHRRPGPRAPLHGDPRRLPPRGGRRRADPNAADFYSLSAPWTLLKNCLKYGTLQIEDSDPNNPSRSGGLKPDAIPVRVKVILLGDFDLYDHLYEVDPDFREIFKIRVDFDSEVSLTSRVLRREYPGLSRGPAGRTTSGP